MTIRQQGAVLVEACVIGMALVLLIYSGRYLMGVQYTLQRLQQSSHAGVFAYEQNAVLPLLNEPGGVRLQQSVSAFAAHPVPQLQSELLGLNSGLSRIQTRSPVSANRWWRQRLMLARQSLLLPDAGPADDMLLARKRLAASPSAWTNAVRSSHAAAKRTRQAAGSLDSAWGRALPDLDWLSPWEHLVPDSNQGGQP